MKKFNGVVVSTKMEKTVVVEVTRLKKHSKYPKFLRRTKRFLADIGDVKDLQEGDSVIIAECRPLSRHKKYKIIEVIRSK